MSVAISRRPGPSLPIEPAMTSGPHPDNGEVDFVLEVGRELWGIEVKASRRVDRGMLRGLSAFAARNDRVRRRILVFLGPRRQTLNGVEALPLEEFLGLLPG